MLKKNALLTPLSQSKCKNPNEVHFIPGNNIHLQHQFTFNVIAAHNQQCTCPKSDMRLQKSSLAKGRYLQHSVDTTTLLLYTPCGQRN